MKNNKSDYKTKISQKIIKILKRFGVKKASLFGSLAKNNFSINSDIDILIDTPEYMDLIDYIELKNELEESTQKKVDLVDFSTIKPIIAEEVLNTQQPLNI
jgi:hypothetical protein